MHMTVSPAITCRTLWLLLCTGALLVCFPPVSRLPSHSQTYLLLLLRDANGKPVTAAAQAVAQAQSSAATYESAPTCSGTPGPSAVADSQGRLWGYENNASCAFRWVWVCGNHQ
jgi:hypothetical protein